MPVSQTLEFAKLDELSLDPMNPRLGRHHAGKTVKQKDVLSLMETWKLDELAVSFLESGQFWTQEALICVKEELYGKERLVVVKGNRRLAALMCLKETFDGHRQDRMWKEIIEGKRQPKDLFSNIPYLIASDRKSVEAYLGFRHVTGIEQWRPSEKAEFISRMIDHGMSYQEVRRKIGAKIDTVRRNYISHRLRLQIEKTGSIPEDSFEDRFSVMFLSLRTSGVQKYLHIDIAAPPERAQEPVPKKHLDALRNFAVWLFGSEDHGPLFTDSRQVDAFGHVLESNDAVKYLQSSEDPNFEVAIRISGGDESETIQSVEKASEHLELALGRAHHFKKSLKLKKASERLGRNAKQLLELFPELLSNLCSEK
jgi:hypothetical protein